MQSLDEPLVIAKSKVSDYLIKLHCVASSCTENDENLNKVK